MLGQVGELNVLIKADTSNLVSGLNKAQQESQNAQNKIQSGWDKAAASMNNVGNKLTVGLTLPIAAAGVAAVKYASDLEETMNKINVIFGDNTDELVTWSESSIDNFGLAQQSALEMVAVFGDMGTSMGFTAEQAAEMGVQITGRAADLASFRNISIDVAKTALTGVFTGETESLKQLGVIMTEVNLDAYALANGYKTAYTEMNQMDKVSLRLNYVMDVTSNSMGDFARTSDSVANQTRTVQERFKEVAAELGQNLLPIAGDLLEWVNGLLEGFSDLSPETQKTIIGFAGVAAAAGPVLKVGSAFITIGKQIGGSFTELISASKTMSTGVIGAFKSMDTAAKATIIGTLVSIGVAIGGVIAAALEADEEFKQLTEDAEAMAASIDDANASFEKTNAEFDIMSQKTPELISRLKELQSANSLTAEEQREQASIIAELNTMYPELALSIDGTTGNLNQSISSIEEQTQAWRENARQMAQIEHYNDLLQKQVEVQAQLAVATGKMKDELVESNVLTREQADALTDAEIAAFAAQYQNQAFGNTLGVVNSNIKESVDSIHILTNEEADLADQIALTDDAIVNNTAVTQDNAQATTEAIDSVTALSEAEVLRLLRLQEQGEVLTEVQAAEIENYKAANAAKYQSLEDFVQAEAAAFEQRVQNLLNTNDKMNLDDELSLAERLENQRHNTELVLQYDQNMQRLQEIALNETNDAKRESMLSYLSSLGDYSEESMGIISQMIDDFAEGGGEMSHQLAAQFVLAMGSDAPKMFNTAYQTGDGAIQSAAEGEKNNPNMQNEATIQMQATVDAMSAMLGTDSPFYRLGLGVINRVELGMRHEAPSLISYSSGLGEQIADAMKSSMTITGKISTSGSGLNQTAKINWYDTGGYFDSPQIIGIAERRPEFVGAADDLESFINKSVNAALYSVDPIIMRDVLPYQSSNGGNGTSNKNITVNNYVTTKELSSAQVDYLIETTNRRLGEALNA